jgi:hypothetical protein
MRERRMEIDAAMRLAAMQVQSYGENRQLRDDQKVYNFCRPRGVQQPVVEEIENDIEHENPPEGPQE